MARTPWQKFDPPTTMVEHAIEYIENYGFVLCALRPASKIPATVEWNSPALGIDTAQKATDALSHGQGAGLIHDKSGTGAFDVDSTDSTRIAFAFFGLDYDGLMARFPRIRSRAGHDKILFRLPKGFDPTKSKIKLTWPDPSGECDAKGRPHQITVFELRGGANQDVLPPSIHPNTGDPYAWEKAPWDFPGGIPVMDGPLLAIWAEWDRFEGQFKAACPWAPVPETDVAPHPVARQVSGVGADVIGQYNTAISLPTILQQHGYKPKGKGRWLAPGSSTKIPGVVFLDEGRKVFSHHASDPLNNGHAHDAFSVLTILDHNGDIAAAVKGAALELGIDLRESVDERIDYHAFVENTLARQAKKPKAARSVEIPDAPEIDRSLIEQAPGMLGKILSWGVTSAHKPLPHITLQAAFAITSAAASRRYRTNLNNWPSLWFLNMEVTASGKEHPESMIEAVLEPAGLGNLIAGAGYTSPGAVFSTLLDKPAHVAVIDEFGKLMQSTQANGNQHKADAITLLMQAFSSCHRVLRPPAYSAMAMTRDQREAMAQRKICNPGVVLYASTTPATFYSSMNRQWIEDGFLGRFVVCHSTVGRQLSRVSESTFAPPQEIIDWVAEVGCRTSDPALAVRSAGIDSAHDAPPEPIGMAFSPEATRLWSSLEADIHNRMGAAERWGVEALFGRTREKAMRMSMLVCLADGAQNRIINSSHAQYASDYVLAMDAALAESAKSHVSDSDFARIKHACLDRLRAAGPKGLTPRELEKKLAAFDALKPREQQDILAALHNSGLVELQTSAGPSGRGRKRVAWVAVQEAENE